MMRTIKPVFAALVALGVAPGSAMASEAGWRLVGTYDATALVGLRNAMKGEDAPPPSDYVWVASGGMVQSCGPAKAPDGLGLFEAEALANHLTPVLGIMLERTDAARPGPLRPDDVRVSLARDDEPVFALRPFLSPRTLVVNIGGEGKLRYKQLVRTQLEMELCMEHKVGRGWIGGSGESLRQAFLLDPPDLGGPDRKYFGGQRDPVPALLGPPDACLQREEGLDMAGAKGGQGEGSLDLVPTDVWGAGLRWCSNVEVGGAEAVSVPRAVPLKIGQIIGQAAPSPRRHWTDLDVTVGAGDAEEDVLVDMTYGDETLLSQHHLFTVIKPEPGEPEKSPGLTDLLAQVPYDYPMLGTVGDPDRYALLLVPGWQLVEGIRRMNAGKLDTPMPDAGAGIQDGVAWVLEHPESMMVQVPMLGEEAGNNWLNLSESTYGGTLGVRSWGYTVGLLAGRKPIALPGVEAPNWDQVKLAQRALQHSLFLGTMAFLLVLSWLGFRRLPDLWSKVPEERVAYWPGLGKKEDEEGAPGLPAGEGGEK